LMPPPMIRRSEILALAITILSDFYAKLYPSSQK